MFNEFDIDKDGYVFKQPIRAVRPLIGIERILLLVN
jgi:hypothetical protein